MKKQNLKQGTGGASAPSSPSLSVKEVRPMDEPKKSDTIRIRMLKQASTSLGYLRPGAAFNAPAALAQGWIKAGLAEEDKILDSAPETK
jgi:hypothetical protein